MLAESDFTKLAELASRRNWNAPRNESWLVPWELRSVDDYGELAGQWLIVSPEFEEEIAGPFATREECVKRIAEIEQGIAEDHADPYPDRIYPEAEMN